MGIRGIYHIYNEYKVSCQQKRIDKVLYNILLESHNSVKKSMQILSKTLGKINWPKMNFQIFSKILEKDDVSAKVAQRFAYIKSNI